jgi:hypothetical protein
LQVGGFSPDMNLQISDNKKPRIAGFFLAGVDALIRPGQQTASCRAPGWSCCL